ncbi:hypothetical protein U6L75_11175 [Cutibacterium acnes]|jgi:hypothetical protein|nr:hypothetical protein OYC58_001689 [Cutibacterium acnes]WGH39245.1 hypothetical protein OYC57_000648 [Cutibacterium acnes]
MGVRVPSVTETKGRRKGRYTKARKSKATLQKRADKLLVEVLDEH